MTHAIITGIGWVFKTSMGYPFHVQYSKFKDRLPIISGKEILCQPYKPFGRMDHFSRLGFAAISFAMADAGIPPSKLKKKIGIIASSATGCLETDILYQATLSQGKGILPSPSLFAYTLPSCFLGEASIYFGLTGENFIIEETLNNGLNGLSMAMNLLEEDECTTMLCGICNSDSDQSARSFKGPSPEPGALFLVLEKETHKPCYGTLKQDPTWAFFSYKNEKIISLTDLAQKCMDSTLKKTQKPCTEK